MSRSKSQSLELPLEDTGILASSARAEPRKGHWYGRRILLVPLLLATFIAGGVTGLYFQPPGLQALFRVTGLEPGAGTDTPIAVAMQRVGEGEELAVVSEGDVVALGRVLPIGDISTVAPPFGAGDARLAELRVRVGDVVAEGDILAVLDSLPQLRRQVETARANLSVAEATLAQTEASVAAARDEARASLERAVATEQVAAVELKRTAVLMERGVTTRSVLDAAIARATEAARDVERQQATLSRYLPNGSSMQADVAVALANVDAARAQHAQAELDVEKAYVRAPIGGTVLDIHVQPGERPGNDGVMDIGDTTLMTVEAEVYQTLIGKVSLGDPVTISAEAIDGVLTGQVSAIGLEIGRQSITSDDPAANTDARVVDVIVLLDAESGNRAARLSNLQVIARIDAGRPAQ